MLNMASPSFGGSGLDTNSSDGLASRLRGIRHLFKDLIDQPRDDFAAIDVAAKLKDAAHDGSQWEDVGETELATIGPTIPHPRANERVGIPSAVRVARSFVR